MTKQEADAVRLAERVARLLYAMQAGMCVEWTDKERTCTAIDCALYEQQYTTYKAMIGTPGINGFAQCQRHALRDTLLHIFQDTPESP